MPETPDTPLPQKSVTRPKRKTLTLRHRRQQHAATHRRRQVWDLMLQGGSCRKIGLALGVSAMQVSRDIRRTLADENRLTAKTVEEYRTIEEARLDHLQVNLAKGVNTGDVPAIRESRKVSESRRRLRGIDAPVKTEVSGVNGGPIQTQGTLATLSVDDLLAKMRAAAEVIQATNQPAQAGVLTAIAPTAESQAASDYARVLAARGNGHGSNGGTT